jgi:Skp family chaperone for outer membrane proteins
MLVPLLLAAQVSTAPQSAAPMAVVNVQRLLAESADGKAATAKLDVLRNEKRKVLADKQAAIQGMKNATPADTAHAQVELQRMVEDADAEVSALGQSLQAELMKKVQPALTQIIEEDHLGLIFEVPSPLIFFVHPSADITSKVIQRLDAPPKQDR